MYNVRAKLYMFKAADWLVFLGDLAQAEYRYACHGNYYL